MDAQRTGKTTVRAPTIPALLPTHAEQLETNQPVQLPRRHQSNAVGAAGASSLWCPCLAAMSEHIAERPGHPAMPVGTQLTVDIDIRRP